MSRSRPLRRSTAESPVAPANAQGVLALARRPNMLATLLRAILFLVLLNERGGAQVQLNPPLARGDAVTQFAISPDGRWVAMEIGHSRTSRNMDNQTNDGRSEVFVRRMGGGDWTSLGVARRLEIGFDVTRFDPGSAYLVTRTEHNWMSYLYSDVRLHSLATGESWDVSAGLSDERRFLRLTFPPAFGPGHGYVVLSTQTYSEELQRYDDALYSVNAFDGSTLSLMNDLHYAQAFDIETASFTDEDSVFFMAVTVPHSSDYRVYRTDLASGTRTRINLPPASGEIDVWSAGGFRLSEDAETIVVSAYPYFADQDDYGAGQLYAVPTTGGQPFPVGNPIATTHRLADFTVVGNDNVLYAIRVSAPDSGDIGYTGLFSTSLSDSAIHELYTPDPTDEETRLATFSVSPDGRRVITRERANGQILLRSIAIDGSDARVIASQPEHSGISGPWFSEDSQRITYLTGFGRGRELFTARIDGTDVLSLTAGLKDTMTFHV